MLLVYLSALIDVVPVFPENTVNISGQPDWLVNSSVVAQVSLFSPFPPFSDYNNQCIIYLYSTYHFYCVINANVDFHNLLNS